MKRDVKIAWTVLFSFIGLAALYLWWDRPQIVRELPRGREDAGVELTKRLREKFPDGTSEEAVVRELTRQGFRPVVCRGTRCVPEVKIMKASQLSSSIICWSFWYVRWKHNEDGTVSLIDGTYIPDCAVP